MAYIIEITQDKVQDLSENIGKMLKYGSRAMDCIDEMQRGSEMGERSRMGWRDEMDYRDMPSDDNDWRYRSRMGERQGVRGTGRYGRY